MRSLATLARWLGPWADASRAPDVHVHEDDIDGTRVRICGVRRRAAFVIAPGLHHAGPDDPRMDRFCRVLAAAGHVVVAPFIRDYLALVPVERAKHDFARVFAARARWDAERPVVFSISFGSLLAFALAAEHGDAIERLVVFGGYHDFHAAMRYCLTGNGRDPLNQPVVIMNLLDHLDHDRAHRDALCAAWRRYLERTWGRPEMKAPERFSPTPEDPPPHLPAP